MNLQELRRRMKWAPSYFPKDELKVEAKTLLDHWGKDDQLDVAMEECAELIQAISKAKRYGIENEDVVLNLIEEVGDVTIVLEHLKLIFNLPQNQINKSIHVKLQRAHERVEADQKKNENVEP